MLSICIPVFNYSVQNLVQSLLIQCANFSKEEVEIILIDDASQGYFVESNRRIESDFIRWVFLKQNVGRAVIRNLFLQYAKGEYLLFLDCDSEIVNETFLKNYFQRIGQKEVEILCGGRIYPEICPSPKQKLRWKYGIKKESKTAIERKKNPNKSFMTNNFLIKSGILQEIPFNEDLKLYGHEDTWFGYQLKVNGIKIEHFENPILNGEIETNEVFLQKTEFAIQSLVFLIKTNGRIKEFEDNIQLTRIYSKLEKYYLLKTIAFFFNLTAELIQPFILRGNSLFLLDFYKLGVFCNKMK